MILLGIFIGIILGTGGVFTALAISEARDKAIDSRERINYAVLRIERDLPFALPAIIESMQRRMTKLESGEVQ